MKPPQNYDKYAHVCQRGVELISNVLLISLGEKNIEIKLKLYSPYFSTILISMVNLNICPHEFDV